MKMKFILNILFIKHIKTGDEEQEDKANRHTFGTNALNQQPIFNQFVSKTYSEIFHKYQNPQSEYSLNKNFNLKLTPHYNYLYENINNKSTDRSVIKSYLKGYNASYDLSSYKYLPPQEEVIDYSMSKKTDGLDYSNIEIDDNESENSSSTSSVFKYESVGKNHNLIMDKCSIDVKLDKNRDIGLDFVIMEIEKMSRTNMKDDLNEILQKYDEIDEMYKNMIQRFVFLNWNEVINEILQKCISNIANSFILSVLPEFFGLKRCILKNENGKYFFDLKSLIILNYIINRFEGVIDETSKIKYSIEIRTMIYPDIADHLIEFKHERKYCRNALLILLEKHPDYDFYKKFYRLISIFDILCEKKIYKNSAEKILKVFRNNLLANIVFYLKQEDIEKHLNRFELLDSSDHTLIILEKKFGMHIIKLFYDLFVAYKLLLDDFIVYILENDNFKVRKIYKIDVLLTKDNLMRFYRKHSSMEIFRSLNATKNLYYSLLCHKFFRYRVSCVFVFNYVKTYLYKPLELCSS